MEWPGQGRTRALTPNSSGKLNQEYSAISRRNLTNQTKVHSKDLVKVLLTFRGGGL